MKTTTSALLLLSLMSLNVFAQDSYEKYEKAIEAAKEEASKALATKDPKQISTAYYSLANLQGEARAKGHTCDIAYLSDIVGNLEIVASNSAWFQSKLPSLPVYQQVSDESLQLQLIAAGLVTGKPMSRGKFVKALQNIFATSDVTLYKPQPGVLPLGHIQFVKGSSINTSFIFTDTGEVETIVGKPVPAEIKEIDKEITIVIGGKAQYTIYVERGEAPVKGEIRSSDSIRIKNVEHDDYMMQLFVSPDECSA